MARHSSLPSGSRRLGFLIPPAFTLANASVVTLAVLKRGLSSRKSRDRRHLHDTTRDCGTDKTDRAAAPEGLPRRRGA